MRNRLAFLLCLLLTTSLRAAPPDIVFADFEGETYGTWTATGTAFGKGPAAGTLPNQMPVSGFKGKRLVNSYHGGDRTTGTLASPGLLKGTVQVQQMGVGGTFSGTPVPAKP